MEPLKRMPKKDYYRIVMTCGILILLASLEILAKTKDLQYFNFINRSLLEHQGSEITYGDFVVSMMASYFARIIVPAGLGLNSYFAYTKSGLTGVFIWSWGLFILAALAFHVLSLELSSIFYYVFIILYLVLLYLIIRLQDRITAERRGL